MKMAGLAMRLSGQQRRGQARERDHVKHSFASARFAPRSSGPCIPACGGSPSSRHRAAAACARPAKLAANFYEVGLTLSARDDHLEAIVAFRRAVLLKPDWPDVWRVLADELRLGGDPSGADAAYAQHIKA